MEQTIKHTIFYNHPASVVWEYLTKPELIELWLMKTDLQPIVGHEFTFTTRPLPQFNFDGIMKCKMIEVVPNEKLSYTWVGGMNGVISLDSIVVWNAFWIWPTVPEAKMIVRAGEFSRMVSP